MEAKDFVHVDPVEDQVRDGQDDIECGKELITEDSQNTSKTVQDDDADPDANPEADDDDDDDDEPSHRPCRRTRPRSLRRESWVGKSLDSGMDHLRLSYETSIGRLHDSVEESLRLA